MSVDIPVKDLPSNAEKLWKNPDQPKDRHLTGEVIPFGELLSLHQRIGNPNHGLFPITSFAKKHMDELLADPVMQAVKDDYTYTAWSMEPDSVTFLKKVIEMYKPRVVLELGSGISTPILSAKLKDVWKDDKDKPVYVTIDQSDDYLAQTLVLVEKAGTKDITRPLIFPITYYRVGGKNEKGEDNTLACYDFNEEKLFEATGGLRPDMIIVDGPTGGGAGGFPFARMLTAPILSMYAKPNALFCMDDAYRNTEIREALNWLESRTMNIIGVKAVGKGLLMGTICENVQNSR